MLESGENVVVWNAVILLAIGLSFWKSRERFSKLEKRLGTQSDELRKLKLELRERLGNIQKRQQLVREVERRLLKGMETLHRKTREILRDDEVQAGYVDAISTMFTEYPVFMGGPALDGYTARALFERIEQDRPAVIVELGSGSSTVMIAALLEKLGLHGTRHISIDHSDYYLDVTRRNMERHGFKRKTEYWHCPLKEGAEGEPAWYSGVAAKLQGISVDLLLVDGPPTDLHPRSREPAMRELWSCLSERAVVILDDATRPDEAAIVEAWKSEYPQMSVRVSHRGKGYAELTRVASSSLIK